jgi:hypothetical protein
MITISHTLGFGDPDSVMGWHELWLGLLRKAEDPVPFIPAITKCTVLERYPRGLLREIVVRDRGPLREQADFEPEKRIVFHQLDDPDLSTIANEIRLDESGGLILNLAVTLSPHGVERATQEPGFLKGLDDYFLSTLHAIVSTLRP